MLWEGPKKVGAIRAGGAAKDPRRKPRRPPAAVCQSRAAFLFRFCVVAVVTELVLKVIGKAADIDVGACTALRLDREVREWVDVVKKLLEAALQKVTEPPFVIEKIVGASKHLRVVLDSADHRLFAEHPDGLVGGGMSGRVVMPIALMW